MGVLANLKIYGASDDCVEFEGAITDEFYVDEKDRWHGWLQSPDGEVAEIEVNFCVDNPDGWQVTVVDPCPWEYHYHIEGYDIEVDISVNIDVPEGTMVEEDNA